MASINSVAILARWRSDHRFICITGTSFAVGCLYPVNVGLIPRSRVINVARDIGANGAYLSPTAGTGRSGFWAQRRDTNLIAALDDEVAFVVGVVGPGEPNGVGLRIARR